MPSYMKSPSSACPGGACEGCADPMCMSKGGKIEIKPHPPDVADLSPEEEHRVRERFEAAAWDKKHMSGAKQMSDDDLFESRKRAGHLPKHGPGFAEGGEVEGPEVDDEIHGMLGEELMSAFESKDRKRVMEGLEALIMSCMNKRGEPDA